MDCKFKTAAFAGGAISHRHCVVFDRWQRGSPSGGSDGSVELRRFTAWRATGSSWPRPRG